jgi:hypothetical protein
MSLSSLKYYVGQNKDCGLRAFNLQVLNQSPDGNDILGIEKAAPRFSSPDRRFLHRAHCCLIYELTIVEFDADELGDVWMYSVLILFCRSISGTPVFFAAAQKETFFLIRSIHSCSVKSLSGATGQHHR